MAERVRVTSSIGCALLSGGRSCAPFWPTAREIPTSRGGSAYETGPIRRIDLALRFEIIAKVAPRETSAVASVHSKLGRFGEVQQPGRPGPSLDDYLYWQESLTNREASGLSIDGFCVAEGVSRSTFDRWVQRLRDGIPESVREEGKTPTLAECQRFLLAAFKQATQLERRVAESEQQVAELNRVLGETAASYQELRQERAASFVLPNRFPCWTRCCLTAGPRHIPWPFSPTGSRNPEPKPLAPEPAAPIAAPAPSDPGPSRPATMDGADAYDSKEPPFDCGCCRA